MEEAKKKLKVYCETSFWSWSVSRPSTDPDHAVKQAWTRKWWVEAAPDCEIHAPFGKSLRTAQNNCRSDQGWVAMPCHCHAGKLHEGGSGMKINDDDPIMEEVYAVRHEISSRFGHDPKRYIESIREMKRCAAEAGLSFLEYCRSVAGADAFLPVHTT